MIKEDDTYRKEKIQNLALAQIRNRKVSQPFRNHLRSLIELLIPFLQSLVHAQT